jgi:aspartyl-tRNA synthetase
MKFEQLSWKRTHYSKEVKPEMDKKEVIVMGWVREIRDIGRLKFIKLADREGFIQITIKENETSSEIMKLVEKIGREYVIAVRGIVRKNDEAPGKREIIPKEIKILNYSDAPLPLEIEARKTPALLDTRLNQRVLDLRKPENQAIFKIQAKLVEGMRNFLIKNGYIEVFSPCLMGAASEGGADLFKVPYFDDVAFLRQDPQLHRELLIISGFDKIFDLGPNWRAEPSHTTYHLCEHRGCAVELSFIRNETDTMRVEEKMIVSVLKFVKKNCKEELELIGKDINIPKIPFPELRFPEIYEILKELGYRIEFGEDLNRRAENLLWNYVKEKYKNNFFFVNRFPFKVKPFYVMRVDEDPQWARSVDLVYKGLELSSGGQREHRYEHLMRNIEEKKLNKNDFKWFTDFFRYGAPPMGGFCLGIERLTMQLLEIPNIREAVLFARTPERLLP